MGKQTYDEYKKQLAAFQDGRRHGKHLPRPNLRDVDLNTVPPEKRGLVSEIAAKEPK